MVYIIDEKMGRGKTTAMIRHLVEGDVSRPVLFITPYRTEIDRVLESCASIGFVTPESADHKFVEAKLMMAERKNIVSTHALFGMFDLEAERLAKENGYTLIMDETPNVISLIDVSRYDARSLFAQHVEFDDDGLLNWITPDYTGKFESYQRYIESGNTYRYSNQTWLRIARRETFESFKDVYMMTYMFPGSTVKPYFDMLGIRYEPLYIGGDNLSNYCLCSSPQPGPAYDYKELITILDDDRLNAIGDEESSLSKNWFIRHTYDGSLDVLHNNTYNYFKNKAKSRSPQSMWTVFKSSEWDEDKKTKSIWVDTVGCDGYRKGFVPCNARGTNQYRHKDTLAFLVNRYQNVPIRNMFAQKGIQASDDYFGLSELLQWVWRSAIRDGKPIRLYVPSSRMRNLLLQWIDDTSKGVRY